MKSLNQDSQLLGGDLNPGSPKYEVSILIKCYMIWYFSFNVVIIGHMSRFDESKYETLTYIYLEMA
jgi:hypothetical protein